VQQFGLDLLILADGWQETAKDDEAFKEQLKFALVAAGVEPTELWSDAAPQSGEDTDPASDDDRDLDYSAVDWAEGSADDWELMQQQLSSSRVQVSGEAASDDEPPVPDMADEFDREWQ
jgi:hypothetical protein